MLINAAQTREYLRTFDFASLFIEVLGWDNYKSNLVVSAGGQDYTLTSIAHKRGVGAFVCSSQPDGRVPDRATRRKIERELANLIHEHLIIYPDAKQTTQVWQTVTHKAGRPIASPERTYYAGQPGDSLISKLQDIAISLDEEESIGVFDVVTRVSAAFNAEKVTKKFYERFQKEHDAFLKFITGIPDEGLQRWYASVMLNRLMFIHFIQEKGFLDGKPDYLKRKLAESKAEGPDHYYSIFLRTLFFDGFATRLQERTPDAKRLLGDIPYLNGGIFAPHQIEQHHGKQIQIPDAAFDRLFSFFEAYNWHLDERPLRNDNEINPDVLGYIFEKYINQKQMGAYYTKEDITEYISKNTIVPFLFDATRKEVAIAFRPEGPVWRLLQEDPDRYIYPAVRKGVELPLPTEIEAGVNDVSARGGWNRPALEEYALPTELWREVVARRTRYAEVRDKLESGGVTDINDLITLNLDIRQFAQDVIENAEGPDLVLAFYRSIERITVLDPTCGSGAFLFAALNILEPLYEACLDKMQGFVDELAALDGKHSPLKYSNFCEILAEAGKHPNRRYFIYKSIILNNLYGVDIMEEAVEICKLRLFLKLVAQVDRDPSKPNGGIEPLPDIDFNILAGNTLVGFATEQEVMQAVTSKGVKGGGTQFKLEFDDTRERFEEKLRKADFAARNFRLQQTQLGGEITAEDKAELRRILGELTDELDHYLATEYGIDHGSRATAMQWRDSHEPFHWFVEFYGIMKRGGFDVIIGNPPYVEYTKVKEDYRIQNYETEECGNLFAFMLERSATLLNDAGYLGMIVPMSLVSTDKMSAIRSYLSRVMGTIHLSHYSGDAHPAILFNGVKMRLSIVLATRKQPSKTGGELFSTNFLRWYSEARPALFQIIAYQPVPSRLCLDSLIPKIGSSIDLAVLGKMYSQTKPLGYFETPASSDAVYAHRIVAHFVKSFDYASLFL